MSEKKDPVEKTPERAPQAELATQEKQVKEAGTQGEADPELDRDTDVSELVLTDEEQADDEEIQDPLDRIAELEQKVKTEHDRLLRASADLDNYRKRVRREIEEVAIRERTAVLREILPVIDSVDLALSSAKPDTPSAGIIEGVEMIRKQFLVATDRFGLEPLESLRQPFDPNFHEAVAQAPSDEIPPGQVMEEVRKGYRLGDRLLRAAMVVVAQEKAPPAESAGSEAPDGGPTGAETSETDAETPETDAETSETDAKAAGEADNDETAAEPKTPDSAEPAGDSAGDEAREDVEKTDEPSNGQEDSNE